MTGDEFLRHISRTRVLIHVVDVASVDGRDPVEDFENINRELSLYDTRLAELPQVIAANKMDLPSAKSGLEFDGERESPIDATARGACQNRGTEKR